jgi:hypothetical protein
MTGIRGLPFAGLRMRAVRPSRALPCGGARFCFSPGVAIFSSEELNHGRAINAIRCSRAVYFPAQGAPGSSSVNPLSPNNVTYTPPPPVQSNDIAAPGAGGLPAFVVKVGPGGSPDFAGTVLLVFDQNGVAYARSAGQFGLVSTTTWTGAGSNPQTAHWNLIDTTT